MLPIADPTVGLKKVVVIFRREVAQPSADILRGHHLGFPIMALLSQGSCQAIECDTGDRCIFSHHPLDPDRTPHLRPTLPFPTDGLLLTYHESPNLLA